MARKRTIKVGDVVEVVGKKENGSRIFHGHDIGALGLVMRVEKGEFRTTCWVRVGNLCQYVQVEDLKHVPMSEVSHVFLSRDRVY